MLFAVSIPALAFSELGRTSSGSTSAGLDQDVHLVPKDARDEDLGEAFTTYNPVIP